MFTALVMIVGMSIPSLDAQAASNPELNFETWDEFNEFMNNGKLIEGDENDISPAAVLPAVAVFVGGILAGFIVDGVLISATGFSGGTWASIAIDYSSCKIKGRTFYLDRDTGETACYGGGGVSW